MNSHKQFGVTDPISLDTPTEQEILLSAEIDDYLHKSGFFEDDESAIQREKVLGKLDLLVKQFVSQVCKELGLDKSGGGKIFTFGSYRLGVHAKGADIDALCVVPKQVTRKHFFNDFFALLSSQAGVTNLLKIEDAYVPLIKFEYFNIPIDLTFTSLQINCINEDINLLDNNILKGMDDKCIISVNGNRVTDEILNLVPDTKVFHKALRCIKYWAQKKKVYGHAYGYFGGVAYALSVAKVCQLFPNACSFTIVNKFFKMLSKFKWPNPIIIKKIEQNELGFRVWDPNNNLADKFHRMPVITPAYPAMCSTHNVFLSTQYWLTREFTKAYKVINEALENKNLNWKEELFSPSDFFLVHKSFLSVFVLTKEDENIDKLVGYVESRLRILCAKLEEVESITYAIPFPKCFNIFDEEESFLRNKYNLQVYKKGRVFFIALDFTGVKMMLHNKKVVVGPVADEFIGSLVEMEGKVFIKSYPKNVVNEFIRNSKK
ncbi:poly (A) polymerase type 1 [Tubulinosema ratisbonensis]|uniref:Poly(A) polymerase n=1 Tax=Tubulinosema ratisbonensis TaxID=291195 RepID=A0A437AQG2_9MICR|nr:poly (A) polymerase type 1 [Tubulinosema ratisbonensis]